MKKHFDLETLMYDIKDMIQAKLNLELEAIDAEKNDSITMEQISNDAYAVLSMDEKVMNYPNFIFIDANAIDTTPLGPVTSKTFTVLVLIISEQVNKTDYVRRVLRYFRALESIFEKNWDSISGGMKFEIQAIPPQDILLLNTSKFYKTSGVQIQGSIA